MLSLFHTEATGLLSEQIFETVKSWTKASVTVLPHWIIQQVQSAMKIMLGATRLSRWSISSVLPDRDWRFSSSSALWVPSSTFWQKSSHFCCMCTWVCWYFKVTEERCSLLRVCVITMLGCLHCVCVWLFHVFCCREKTYSPQGHDRKYVIFYTTCALSLSNEQIFTWIKMNIFSWEINQPYKLQ